MRVGKIEAVKNIYVANRHLLYAYKFKGVIILARKLYCS